MLVEWERSQIRKGGHHARELEQAQQERRRQLRGALPDLPPLPTYQSLFSLLESALKRMNDDQSLETETLTTMRLERTHFQETIVQLQADVEAYGNKYDFFEEFRVWTEDFVQWLDVKMPEVERLEEEWLRLHRRRRAGVQQRRLQRMQDALDDLVKGTHILENERANGTFSNYFNCHHHNHCSYTFKQ